VCPIYSTVAVLYVVGADIHNHGQSCSDNSLTIPPLFTGKGGKNRRRGKGDGEEAKRELEFKEEGQEYAQVVRMLGNGRCECFCYDGVTRLGHIRGKMRKKVWVTAGDIVLVGKRDFQDEKVDIIHKYSADEARNLKQYGELPETARINETAVDQAMAGEGDDDDIGIDFDDI
jgi:translation initiation factor 1A